MNSHPVIIIGGGPAGLMAADIVSAAGHAVEVYDRMPSVGRKFLMAGRGGLNLTHTEGFSDFMTRYREAADWLAPAITRFTPQMLRDWCENLGEPTFAGTSGRVFPQSFKASPLLRRWLARLETQGVRFHLQHSWQGWDSQNRLLFATPQGETISVTPSATLLALGGASWPRLGSDGGWTAILTGRGVPLSPLRPANCGFITGWSDIFRTRFAGQPLKSIALSCHGETVRGEAMITERGLEGGAIYALSALLREEIAQKGQALLTCDLRPALKTTELAAKLDVPRGRQSFSTYLRKSLALSPAAVGLIQEVIGRNASTLSPRALATAIKALPITLTDICPLDRAISTAGGIKRAALDDNFMIKTMPGVFAAGEMLDWEAPTGGYLLQATFSTAVAAAHGLQDWLRAR